jgi:hypothetical protein
MSNEHRTTTAQREAQKDYNARQRERGYFQTRPWLPNELRLWHELVVRRAREAKEYGTDFVIPDAPAIAYTPREDDEPDQDDAEE